MLGPALALEASDTMKAWKNASDKDRSELLEQVIGKDAAQSAGVAKCMNETSATPGHSDLPIGEVAKVCASSGKCRAAGLTSSAPTGAKRSLRRPEDERRDVDAAVRAALHRMAVATDCPPPISGRDATAVDGWKGGRVV